MRRIVSWLHYSLRQRTRRLARRVRHTTLGSHLGDETQSLKDAAKDAKEMITKLHQPPPGLGTGLCARCHCSKDAIVFRVHDAAQCYEELPPDTNDAYLEAAISVALARGFFGVCTARTKRASTWFAQKPMPPSAKTDCFPLKK